MKSRLIALLLFGLTLGLGVPRVQAADPTAAFVPDEVIVQYRAGTTDAHEQRARGRTNASHKSLLRDRAQGNGRLELAALPPGSNVQAALASLRADPAVAFAEPNWIYTTGPELAARSPNDPKVDQGSIWGMYGDAHKVLDATTYSTLLSTYHLGGNLYGSQANEAWADFQSNVPAGVDPNQRVGSKAIYVGVIDSGIDYRHPDLDANMWINPKEKADKRDNDGNGYKDDIYGWNFVANNNKTFVATDDESHGTHVAGTIGAEGNNGIGVAGVNWNVSLITAKFFGSGGTSGSLDNAAKAIYYLTDLKTKHGVNVVAINASWGCYCLSRTLYDAIAAANEAQILFVAAAGNDGSTNRFYPASHSAPTASSDPASDGWPALANVISVAAIDENGNLASFSNYGAPTETGRIEPVHLGAPGVNIGSTGPNNTYIWKSGTSMAAPHVTGAAALYAAKALYEGRARPSSAEIKNSLLATTLPTASLDSKTSTGGRLDISCVLQTVVKSPDGTISAGTCAK